MLILLDIDGVMVPTTTWKPTEILPDGFARFSTRATTSLQTIIDGTGAKIVLTTSHQSRFSIPQWEEIFRGRGIVARIDVLGSSNPGSSRKEQILHWHLSSNTSERFVILDDDKSLNGLPDYLKDKTIVTSGTVGLTPEEAVQAIKILGKEAFEIV